MPSVKKPQPDDKSQSERFKKKARELETDESGETFERVIRTVAPRKTPKRDITKNSD